ncbi:Ig-like domain-containing protein [Streptomyces sp. NEAU-YJ-81]|uniref:Ig-like domain-containing protein n=1 Tax=Streptomyces sp. NEAU-YJ-81 TaxID=2820288 RepID=UPI001ABCE6B3|nr:Ig-like domain-containing protein [Streptomyces sp. NEAU-YJ-81]MBO3680713.1 Ig-like domain repeat protein [Streptomyces sp. NEAU-YJ-81]
MPSPTVTLVTVSPNPAAFGQSVTLTATVIPLGVGTPTGTVTFVVTGGPTLMGTLSGGTTSVTVPAGLSVGAHPVVATYNGDTNFTSSTGTNVILVTQASTTTSVTSAPDPSSLGQSVTFTATVTPVAPGAGVPTGTVTFIIGGSGGGTFVQPLVGGTATLSLNTLGVGTHPVVVLYTGDGNFLPSTGTDTHTVNPAPAATTTTVTSSVNPSVFGQPVTFTVTVTPNPPATGTPTGTVTIMVSGTGGGTVIKALMGGTASETFSNLGTGPHTVTATYSGDANFAASSGTLPTQTVNKASTTTSVSSSPNPSTAGQDVTYVAFVQPVPPGAGVRTGTVTFTITDGTNTVTGTGSVDASGFAFFTDTSASLPAGGYTITAVYSGDTNFNGSTGTNNQTIT